MPTVAEQLRQAREARNLTVQQVADVTKIRTDHLRALEEGNFDMFSAPVYIRGFVRTYSTLLKLDVRQTMGAGGGTGPNGEVLRAAAPGETPPRRARLPHAPAFEGGLAKLAARVGGGCLSGSPLFGLAGLAALLSAEGIEACHLSIHPKRLRGYLAPADAHAAALSARRWREMHPSYRSVLPA